MVNGANCVSKRHGGSEVAPAAVPLVKDAVRGVTIEQCRELVVAIESCETSVEVLSLCRKLIGETAPELLELI